MCGENKQEFADVIGLTFVSLDLTLDDGQGASSAWDGGRATNHWTHPNTSQTY